MESPRPRSLEFGSILPFLAIAAFLGFLYWTRPSKPKWVVDYYDSGTKRSEGLYITTDEPAMTNFGRTRVKDGKWTTWYRDGKKESEGTFRGGWKVGRWVYWWENGREKAAGSYLDNDSRTEAGSKQGEWRFWNRDGSLDASRSGHYHHDEKGWFEPGSGRIVQYDTGVKDDGL